MFKQSLNKIIKKNQISLMKTGKTQDSTNAVKKLLLIYCFPDSKPTCEAKKVELFNNGKKRIKKKISFKNKSRGRNGEGNLFEVMETEIYFVWL